MFFERDLTSFVYFCQLNFTPVSSESKHSSKLGRWKIQKETVITEFESTMKDKLDSETFFHKSHPSLPNEKKRTRNLWRSLTLSISLQKEVDENSKTFNMYFWRWIMMDKGNVCIAKTCCELHYPFLQR